MRSWRRYLGAACLVLLHCSVPSAQTLPDASPPPGSQVLHPADGTPAGGGPAGGGPVFVYDVARDFGDSRSLKGRFAFYPEKLIVSRGDPRTNPLQISVPGRWTNANDISQIQPRAGYASVKIPVEIQNALAGERFSLMLPVIHSAWRLYIDGRIAASGGRAGTTRDASRAGFGPRIVQLPESANGRYELIFEVSNFQDKDPWIREEMFIGFSSMVERQLIRALAADGVLVLIMLSITVFLIVNFAVKPLFPSYVLLGIFAFALGLRHSTVGYHLLSVLFPQLPYVLAYRIAYICFYAAVVFGYEYLTVEFFEEPWPAVSPFIQITGGLFTLLTLAAPKYIFQTTLPGAQIFALAVVLYSSWRMIQAAAAGSPKARTMLIGMLLMTIAVVNDSVGANLPGNNRELSALFLLLITTGHSIYLHWTMSRGYEISLELSGRLKRLLKKQESIRANLAREVETRTRELSDALSESQRANEAKSQFLANISHEIRTPLNGILGFSEILHQQNHDPDLEGYIDLIYKESVRLLEIINLILDFSKIEAGKLQLEPRVFDFHEMLQSINLTANMLAARQNLRYFSEFDDSLPRYYVGDSLRIRQILDNLIANAFKFTEIGFVKFSVLKNDDSGLRFTVKDTGIGIPESKQEKIFESFEQADSSTSRRFGGTGLGTAIAKRLTDEMQGRIFFESRQGEGSVFTVDLPLEAARSSDWAKASASSPDTEREKSPGFKDLTIVPRWSNMPRALVAEDYAVNLELTTRHLSAAGWEVVEAKDGNQAIDAVESGHFDLILMDIQMPNTDGLEAAQIIRGRLGYRGPIIGVSANAYPSDRERCIEAGMQDLVSKPIRRRELLEAISRQVPAGSYIDLSKTVTPVPIDTRGSDQEKEAERSNLLDELDGDLINFVGLLRGFLKILPEQIRIMEDANLAEDMKTLHRGAHSIRGGALNFGGTDLAEIAGQIEQAVKAGDGKSVTQLLENLKAYAEALQQA